MWLKSCLSGVKSHLDLCPGSEAELPVSFSIAKVLFLDPWDTAIAMRLTVFKFGKSLSLSLPGKYPIGHTGWENKEDFTLPCKYGGINNCKPKKSPTISGFLNATNCRKQDCYFIACRSSLFSPVLELM